MSTSTSKASGGRESKQGPVLGSSGRTSQDKRLGEPALALRPSQKELMQRLLQEPSTEEARANIRRTKTAERSSAPQTTVRQQASEESEALPPRKSVSDTGKIRRTRTRREKSGDLLEEHSSRRSQNGEEEHNTPRQSKERVRSASRARSASPGTKEKAEDQAKDRQLRKSSDPTAELRRSRTAEQTRRKKRVKSPREAGTAAPLTTSLNLKVEGIAALNQLLKRVFPEDEAARTGVRQVMRQVHAFQPTAASDTARKEFNMKVLQLLTGLHDEDRKALLRFTGAMEESEEDEEPGSIWIRYGKALATYTELLNRVERKLTNSPVADTVFGFVQTNSQLDFN